MSVSFSAPSGQRGKSLAQASSICFDESISFDVWSRSEATVFPPDNVHFQQAAQISKALVDEQVDFEAMVNIGWGKRL